MKVDERKYYFVINELGKKAGEVGGRRRAGEAAGHGLCFSGVVSTLVGR